MPDLDISIVFGIMAAIVLYVAWFVIRKFFGLVIVVALLGAFLYFYNDLNRAWHGLGETIDKVVVIEGNKMAATAIVMARPRDSPKRTYTF